MSFKVQVVQKIEQGLLTTTSAQRKYGIQFRSTLVNWLRKYGNLDWENQPPSNMPKSPEPVVVRVLSVASLRTANKTKVCRP